MNADKIPSGVGGWLALLVAGLTFLGPLVGAGRLMTEFESAEQATPQLLQSVPWSTYKVSSWVIFVVTAVVSISAGIVLSSRNRPSAVTYAIICLWVIGPIGNFVYLVTAVLVFGETAAAAALPEMLGGITGSIIVSAVWTAYLLRSKRVKNTYYGVQLNGVVS